MPTMPVENSDAVDAIKERARATWSAGNYDAFVDGIWAVGGEVTARARVAPGDLVLDVACGTGNAAVQAAQAGGTVTGVDLTPELFPAARRRAAEAGVEVELVEGDAEALPFEDESFDVVVSTFGVMFAPRHAVAAGELVRVLRPGGRIGLASWDPGGTVGAMFRSAAGHLPPPPAIAEPPLQWGTEEHVQELLGGHLDLEFAHLDVATFSGDDLNETIDRFIDAFPTLVTTRALLEPQGRWPAAETDIRRALAMAVAEPPTYLLVTGSKRG